MVLGSGLLVPKYKKIDVLFFIVSFTFFVHILEKINSFFLVFCKKNNYNFKTNAASTVLKDGTYNIHLYDSCQIFKRCSGLISRTIKYVNVMMSRVMASAWCEVLLRVADSHIIHIHNVLEQEERVIMNVLAECVLPYVSQLFQWFILFNSSSTFTSNNW
jgi:hypothetical protein